MGKVRSLAVSFDRKAYSSGDTVSGRVHLEVTEEISVKSLKIHAKGRAKVHWTESRRTGDKTETTVYFAKEKYFSQWYILIGHERDGVHIIHSGWHEYAFSFQLPTPLPTSFEGRHGRVRYWVKAELARPWHLSVTSRKEFTVFECIDINTPTLLSPQVGTGEKTVCCWFCASGPISLHAKIERKGYTAGESIQIFAEFENYSSRTVVPKAAIYQMQTFSARGKTNTTNQLLTKLLGESLSPGKTATWNGQLLKIPLVSPSILNCSIICVDYYLLVYIDIPGAINLSLCFPLVIGTIPLQTVWQQNIKCEQPM